MGLLTSEYRRGGASFRDRIKEGSGCGICDMVAITVGPSPRAAPSASHKCSPPSPVKCRVKEIREDVRSHECERLVATETEQRQLQRELRFHARWPLVRAFYAAVAERVPENKRKIWLRLVAAQLHDAVVGSAATPAQTEIAVTTALRAFIPCSSEWRDVLQALHRAVGIFHREDDSVYDYREFLCACLVLDRWQDGEVRMLSLWMDEYSLPIQPVGEMAIKAAEIPRLLMTPCSGTVDEQAMAPHIALLLQSTPKINTNTTGTCGWIRVADIKRFVGE
jgi:hypothetical protein